MNTNLTRAQAAARLGHARPGSGLLPMTLAFALSWLTMLGHNLFELPLALIDIPNSGPLLVDAFLLAALVWRPMSRRAPMAVLGWALLNLVIGGVVTVLPLPQLPFVPEQSASHYLAHLIYAAGQVPLVVLAVTACRRRPPVDAHLR